MKDIKKDILSVSPWVGRGMGILLGLVTIFAGLWFQLYQQKKHISQQEEVVRSVDSTNMQLTQQLLDYQNQIDSLKLVRVTTAQEVDSLKKQLQLTQERYHELLLVAEEYREDKRREAWREYFNGPDLYR